MNSLELCRRTRAYVHGVGFIILSNAIKTYMRINARRDALEKEMEEKGIKHSAEEIRKLGDKAPDFRYTL